MNVKALYTALLGHLEHRTAIRDGLKLLEFDILYKFDTNRPGIRLHLEKFSDIVVVSPEQPGSIPYGRYDDTQHAVYKLLALIRQAADPGAPEPNKDMSMFRTGRGFSIVAFMDSYGTKCRIQQSSVATSNNLWVGVADPKLMCMARDAIKHGYVPPDHESTGWVELPIPEDATILNSDMHLNERQVRYLVGHLQRWLEEGDLRDGFPYQEPITRDAWEILAAVIVAAFPQSEVGQFLAELELDDIPDNVVEQNLLWLKSDEYKTWREDPTTDGWMRKRDTTELPELLAGLAEAELKPGGINIHWAIDDIRTIDAELTDDECQAVLDRAKRRHDASVGLTWCILEDHVNDFKKERQQRLDEPAAE